MQTKPRRGATSRNPKVKRAFEVMENWIGRIVTSRIHQHKMIYISTQKSIEYIV